MYGKAQSQQVLLFWQNFAALFFNGTARKGALAMLTLAIVEDDPVCAAQLKENVERFCREYQIALQLKTLT